MIVTRTIAELTRSIITAVTSGAQTRAVVMTMGALHEGHLALVDEAKKVADHVSVTIFVNPLQFGPEEDFDRYPRDLEADCALLESHGVDVVFAPAVEEIYPIYPPVVTVSAGKAGTILEGKIRPGHFDGVLTVVAKLLQITSPDIAVFGQKDAQQLALVRSMVRDLNFPVEIIAVPIIRDADGLALSSRNAYLSPEERQHALALSRALTAASENSTRGTAAALRAAQEILKAQTQVDVDYLEILDPSTLEELPEDYAGTALMVVAARLGQTRLLDNALLEITQAPISG